jgi:hypothetical protein
MTKPVALTRSTKAIAMNFRKDRQSLAEDLLQSGQGVSCRDLRWVVGLLVRQMIERRTWLWYA